MTEDKLKSMASMSFMSRLPATDAVDEEAIPRAVEDEDGEDVGVLTDIPSTKNRVLATYRICELYRGLVVHSSAHDKRRQKAGTRASGICKSNPSRDQSDQQTHLCLPCREAIRLRALSFPVHQLEVNVEERKISAPRP